MGQISYDIGRTDIGVPDAQLDVLHWSRLAVAVMRRVHAGDRCPGPFVPSRRIGLQPSGLHAGARQFHSAGGMGQSIGAGLFRIVSDRARRSAKLTASWRCVIAALQQGDGPRALLLGQLYGARRRTVVARPRRLGLGDIKLAAAAGFFLVWSPIVDCGRACHATSLRPTNDLISRGRGPRRAGARGARSPSR